MAPGTTIGAAHPVSMGGVGQMDTNMAAKVENDAAAYIRAIAEKRGRNADWAQSAVTESVALSETEALESNVVDLVVGSLDDLLAALDGRSVGMGARTIVLATQGARTERIKMTWRDRFLATIANPNLAYILFVIGLLGLYFELSTPGAVLPGVAGAICLILALFAFQTLSVNYAGVLLIVFSVILFIVDAKAATHGVLTAGGLIAMFIGSVMLFDMPEQSVRLSLHVIIAVVLATGLFFAIGVCLSARAMHRRPTTGDAGLVGQQGDARTPITRAAGTVFVAGTHWNAVAKSDIAAGSRVRVAGVKGMTLEVEEIGGQEKTLGAQGGNA
jgi:membrane-bound serine protease (ClpP class)